MSLTLEAFYQQVHFLSTIKLWNLEPPAIRGMFDLFPANAETKQVAIDEDAFAAACSAVMDSEFGKPADLLKAYKAERLRQVDARKPAALPPAPRPEHVTEGLAKFHRGMVWLKSRKAGLHQCPHGGCTATGGNPFARAACQCFADLWAEPLTDEDWSLSQGVEPLATVPNLFPGDDSPAVVRPDPKEADLVWTS